MEACLDDKQERTSHRESTHGTDGNKALARFSFGPCGKNVIRAKAREPSSPRPWIDGELSDSWIVSDEL
jgi:hypothetical protein